MLMISLIIRRETSIMLAPSGYRVQAWCRTPMAASPSCGRASPLRNPTGSAFGRQSQRLEDVEMIL